MSTGVKHSFITSIKDQCINKYVYNEQLFPKLELLFTNTVACTFS